MKKLLLFNLLWSCLGLSLVFAENSIHVNEISHTVKNGETLDKILQDRGYKNIKGFWGVLRQTLLRNDLTLTQDLTPGSIIILPYSPGENKNYQKRELAQDKSYDLGEPLEIEGDTFAKPVPSIPVTETTIVENIEAEPTEELNPLVIPNETKEQPSPLVLEDIVKPIENKNQIIEKKIVKEVIKEIYKEKIVYIDKSKESYPDWSSLQFFLGHKFTKMSLDDPISGTARLDSQYHFEYGVRWTQKWDKNFFFYSQLDVDMLSFDKPQGVSFNKARFFLPGMELGVQFKVGQERLTFAFQYKSEVQSLTKVNSVLALTSTEVSSLVFGFERVLEGKKHYKFIGEASMGYVIPRENNGIKIEDGYHLKIGGTIRYQKPDYRLEFKPYFQWSQKKTNLTEEDRQSFGIQFGYGKDF